MIHDDELDEETEAQLRVDEEIEAQEIAFDCAVVAAEALGVQLDDLL